MLCRKRPLFLKVAFLYGLGNKIEILVLLLIVAHWIKNESGSYQIIIVFECPTPCKFTKNSQTIFCLLHTAPFFEPLVSSLQSVTVVTIKISRALLEIVHNLSGDLAHRSEKQTLLCKCPKMLRLTTSHHYVFQQNNLYLRIIFSE